MTASTVTTKKSTKVADSIQKQKPKYSYAQRVLKAVSDLRTRQKKDAIHVTAIKNQIKKNAESKNDKLGPHWQTRVTSTVHNLEDAGVLSQTPRRASVAFTPEAKKQLARERRFSSPGGLSDAGEYTLFKDLAHKFSAGELQSSARNRRRSSGTHSLYGGSTTGTSADRSPAKMSKAELIAEVQKLRARTATPSQFGGGSSRAVPPPPAGNDNHGDSDDDLTDIGDTEGNTTQATVEMITPLKDRISQLRAPRNGLLRTPSGTYISLISKQPTPEPSEVDQHSDTADQQAGVGSNDNDMDFGGLDDSFAATQELQDDSFDLDQNTPERNVVDEVAELKQQLETMARERQTEAANFEAEITDLKNQLTTTSNSSKTTADLLTQKTAAFTELRSAHDALTVRLAETGSQLDAVTKDLEEKERKLAQTNLDLEHANSGRVEVEAALEVAQQTIIKLREQASKDSVAWNDESAALMSRLTGTENEKKALNERLERAELEVKDLQSTIEGKDHELADMKTDLLEKERFIDEAQRLSNRQSREIEHLNSINTHLETDMQAQASLLQNKIDELKIRFVEAQTARDDLQHQTIILQAQLQETQAQVVAARQAEEAAQTLANATAQQLIESQATVQTLQVQNDDRTQQIAALQATLTQRTEALTKAAEEYASLEKSLSNIAADLRVSEAEVADLQTKLGEMETRAENAEAEVDCLMESLHDRELAMEEARDTLDKLEEMEEVIRHAKRRMSEVTPASPSQKRRKRSSVEPSSMLADSSMI